jgi:hypothetical protein
MPRSFTRAAQRAGWEARTARANKRAADLAPIIAELQASGITSKQGIAAALNERGIQTPRGSGRWYHPQVGRLLARFVAHLDLIAERRRAQPGRRPPTPEQVARFRRWFDTQWPSSAASR